MKSFFQKMSESLKYGAALVAGGFYILAIIILLNNDNWVGISALTTMFLAIAAFWAIWQNYSFRRKGKKERLLNEIIEWAIDVAKCGVKDDKGSEVWSNFAARYFDKVHVTNIKVEDFLREKFIIEFSRAADFLFTFTVMKGKSHYISRASLSLGQELQNAVLSLTRDLGMHIELIMNYQKDIRSKLNSIEEVTNQELIQEDSNNYIEEIGNHKQQLDLLAYKVIEIATKIKTKNMGEKEENMSKEGEATRTNEPTLKDIEEHLKRQDKQTKRTTYFAGAVLGASIVLVAVSLWIGRFILSTSAFYWQYTFLLVVGFGFMFWCWWKQSKVK